MDNTVYNKISINGESTQLAIDRLTSTLYYEVNQDLYKNNLLLNSNDNIGSIGTELWALEFNCFNGLLYAMYAFDNTDSIYTINPSTLDINLIEY